MDLQLTRELKAFQCQRASHFFESRFFIVCLISTGPREAGGAQNHCPDFADKSHVEEEVGRQPSGGLWVRSNPGVNWIRYPEEVRAIKFPGLHLALVE